MRAKSASDTDASRAVSFVATTSRYEKRSQRPEAMPEKDLEKELKRLERAMLDAARDLEFEKAAELRDRLHALKQAMFGVDVPFTG